MLCGKVERKTVKNTLLKKHVLKLPGKSRPFQAGQKLSERMSNEQPLNEQR